MHALKVSKVNIIIYAIVTRYVFIFTLTVCRAAAQKVSQFCPDEEKWLKYASPGDRYSSGKCGNKVPVSSREHNTKLYLHDMYMQFCSITCEKKKVNALSCEKSFQSRFKKCIKGIIELEEGEDAIDTLIDDCFRKCLSKGKVSGDCRADVKNYDLCFPNCIKVIYGRETKPGSEAAFQALLQSSPKPSDGILISADFLVI